MPEEQLTVAEGGAVSGKPPERRGVDKGSSPQTGAGPGWTPRGKAGVGRVWAEAPALASRLAFSMKCIQVEVR